MLCYAPYMKWLLKAIKLYFTHVVTFTNHFEKETEGKLGEVSFFFCDMYILRAISHMLCYAPCMKWLLKAVKLYFTHVVKFTNHFEKGT